MNFWLKQTKVFAVFALFFAAYSSLWSQDSIYQLRAGTKIRLRMDAEINSKISSVNDTFTTKLVRPVTVRETIVLPVGTTVEGRITSVKRAASGGRGGAIEVSFEMLRFTDGARREIEGVLVNELKSRTSGTTTFLSIAGGTALGAIFGAVSKTDNGVLIGAGLGAGAGTGAALLQKGKNVRIKTDEEFEIELKKDVILPVRDY